MCDRMWHDPFICVTFLIHTYDMSHSYVWHDLFICVTWLIHMCDMTHSWHDSSDMTHLYLISSSIRDFRKLIHMNDTTHPYVSHGASICVPWCMHRWDMTRLYQKMTHSYVWHDIKFHECVCVLGGWGCGATWGSSSVRVCIEGMGGLGYQRLVKKVEEEILTHISKRVAFVACESWHTSCHVNESCHMNESCHTYEWVRRLSPVSHDTHHVIWMSHDTHIRMSQTSIACESWHTSCLYAGSVSLCR